MAEKKEKPKRDFDRYSWASVLQRINSSEESAKYLEGALIENAMKQGSNGAGLEGIVAGAMTDENSRENAVAYTAQQYEAEMEGVTIGEYIGNYGDVVKKYFGDEAPSIKEYSEMTLNDFHKKIVELQHDKKHPTDENKRKKASEELEKYGPLSVILNIIGDEYFKNYLPKAIERTNKLLAKKVITNMKIKGKEKK